ncbi:MAG: hypothetical protein FWF80_01205 [Defluviitaleaceae bacterium]|nr:hypothetical protein [Defluviitaleaceae bacterium]
MNYGNLIDFLQSDGVRFAAFIIAVGGSALTWFLILPLVKGKDTWREILADLKKIILWEMKGNGRNLILVSNFHKIKWWKFVERVQMETETIHIYHEEKSSDAQ